MVVPCAASIAWIEGLPFLGSLCGCRSIGSRTWMHTISISMSIIMVMEHGNARSGSLLCELADLQEPPVTVLCVCQYPSCWILGMPTVVRGHVAAAARSVADEKRAYVVRANSTLGREQHTRPR